MNDDNIITVQECFNPEGDLQLLSKAKVYESPVNWSSLEQANFVQFGNGINLKENEKYVVSLELAEKHKIVGIMSCIGYTFVDKDGLSRSGHLVFSDKNKRFWRDPELNEILNLSEELEITFFVNYTFHKYKYEEPWNVIISKIRTICPDRHKSRIVLANTRVSIDRNESRIEALNIEIDPDMGIKLWSGSSDGPTFECFDHLSL